MKKIIALCVLMVVQTTAFPMLVACSALRSAQRPSNVLHAPVRPLTIPPEQSKPAEKEFFATAYALRPLIDEFGWHVLKKALLEYTAQNRSIALCLISRREQNNQLVVAVKREGDNIDVARGSRVVVGSYLPNGLLRYEHMRQIDKQKDGVVVQELLLKLKKNN